MRILFVADGRSPIARSWISPFILAGEEVHLATTYQCQPMDGLGSFELVPVAFSGLKGGQSGQSGAAAGINWRTRARHYLGPLTVPVAASALDQLTSQLKPDLVHALRIPFEGMLAAWSRPLAPLIISTWGNDFTLHAKGSLLMRWLTSRTMKGAVGLHADCQRDLRLGMQYGFKQDGRTVVLPGNGGLDPLYLDPDPPDLPGGSEVAQLLDDLAPGTPLVVNPRGFRAYVRNDTFFASIPLLRARRPEVVFACPAMRGEPLAEQWLAEPGVGRGLRLLGRLSAPEMAVLLRRAQLVVSPSEHDGTPNSLLEAMASGAVPIAGDLESIREWIVDGRNGRLVDPSEPAELAQAIWRSLEDESWRQKAQMYNRALIEERASRRVVFSKAKDFYQQVQQARPML